MHWNVLHYNINQRTIDDYDIFKHAGFAKDVEKMLGERFDRKSFDERLKSALLYWFWSRCEYEILVCGWPPSHSDTQRKVDIYSQVMLNFEIFSDYVWSNKEAKS